LDRFWSWTRYRFRGDVAGVLGVVNDFARCHEPVTATVERIVRAIGRPFPVSQAGASGTELRQSLEDTGVGSDGARVLARR